MKTYTIRITTVDGLYADYMVEASCLLVAKEKAKQTFFKAYPDADKNVKASLTTPKPEIIKEIMRILKEANDRNVQS